MTDQEAGPPDSHSKEPNNRDTANSFDKSPAYLTNNDIRVSATLTNDLRSTKISVTSSKYTKTHHILFGSLSDLAEQLNIHPWLLRFDDEAGYDEYLKDSRWKIYLRRCNIYVIMLAMSMFLTLRQPRGIIPAIILVIGFIVYAVPRMMGKERTTTNWNKIMPATYLLCIMVLGIFHTLNSLMNDPRTFDTLNIFIAMLNFDFILNYHINLPIGLATGALATILFLSPLYALVPNSFDTDKLFFMLGSLTSGGVLRYQNELFARVGYRIIKMKQFKNANVNALVSDSTSESRSDNKSESRPSSPTSPTSPSQALTPPQTRKKRTRVQKLQSQLYKLATLDEWKRIIFKSFSDPELEQQFKIYAQEKIRFNLVIPTVMGLVMLGSIASSSVVLDYTPDNQLRVYLWIAAWLCVIVVNFLLNYHIGGRQLVILCSFISLATLVFVFYSFFTIDNQWRNFISVIWLNLSVLGFRYSYFLIFQQFTMLLMLINQIINSVYKNERLSVVIPVMFLVWIFFSYIVLSISSNLEKKFRAFFLIRSSQGARKSVRESMAKESNMMRHDSLFRNDSFVRNDSFARTDTKDSTISALLKADSILQKETKDAKEVIRTDSSAVKNESKEEEIKKQDT